MHQPDFGTECNVFIFAFGFENALVVWAFVDSISYFDPSPVSTEQL
jgi:hypothetical protein